MLPAPIPANEAERLKALRRLKILDTPAEERFDRITKLAAFLFKVPISTLTIIDSEREWFKSRQGMRKRQSPRKVSFCGHAMLADETFIIPDTLKDERFTDNPAVVGGPHIRFYAGTPIRSADGLRVGVLCIKDTKPRELNIREVDILKALGTWAELELNFSELGRALELRRTAEDKIVEINRVLKILNVILRHDMVNDLSIIKASVSLMAATKDVSKVKDVLAIIDRSMRLIVMMKDLEAAVSTGLGLKNYDLRAVVNKVAASFPDLEFEIDGRGSIKADEAIYSAIENIVRNAKIHADAKHIKIDIVHSLHGIDLRIANDGNNMPAAAKEHLFEEGFHYGKTGRTGLGLYIVRKTIERYGGRVRVEPYKPSGTVFILELLRA